MTKYNSKILVIEPYFSGSHAAWCKAIADFSRHRIEILQLPGRHWKWRMHGAAVELARQYRELTELPDLIVVSDMIDVACFCALAGITENSPPLALYFHENQLVYPASPNDTDIEQGRDLHYGFINYTSALAAGRVFFNSSYHRQIFLDSLRKLIANMPDYNNLNTVDAIAGKSCVLPVGIDTAALERYRPTDEQKRPGKPPLILYNHRWEHDKNPEEFFAALYEVEARGIDFRLAVVGKSGANRPPCFEEAHKQLKSKIVQFGYLDSFADYARLLWQADLLPVTSNQDFFGISVTEALFCRTIPLLPERLAYPDLLDKTEFAAYYYNRHEQLVQKLSRFLIDPPTAATDRLATIAAAFDWRTVVSRYDDEFEKYINSANEA